MADYDCTKRDCYVEETKKKMKTEQFVLFAKSMAAGNLFSRSSRKKKKQKKASKKPIVCFADSLCHIYYKKGHWILEYSKKDQIKIKHVKSGGFANLAMNYLQFSKDYRVGKILIISVITVSRAIILPNYTIISHIFIFWLKFIYFLLWSHK